MTEIHLPIPPSWSAGETRSFLDHCRDLARGRSRARPLHGESSSGPSSNASVVAAAAVIRDLAEQGWLISVSKRELTVQAPEPEVDADAERSRVRRQELIKRDEQLKQPSVARFVSRMEEPHEFRGRFVSVFSLMRDGRELAERLAEQGEASTACDARELIDPYVQIVHTGERCEHTGLRLTDVWRYFRLTWSNQHTSTPGRTMMLLVRDRAAPDHPVIGIAALASAIVQIRERDDWIGWQPEAVLTDWLASPSKRIARWALERLESSYRELHLADLIQDGLYWTPLWSDPTTDAIEKLRSEGRRSRTEHQRFQNRTASKADLDTSDPDEVRDRAEQYLFRSKRAAALADLLQARMTLLPHFRTGPSRDGLRNALEDPASASCAVGDRPASEG